MTAGGDPQNTHERCLPRQREVPAGRGPLLAEDHHHLCCNRPAQLRGGFSCQGVSFIAGYLILWLLDVPVDGILPEYCGPLMLSPRQARGPPRSWRRPSCWRWGPGRDRHSVLCTPVMLRRFVCLFYKPQPTCFASGIVCSRRAPRSPSRRP